MDGFVSIRRGLMRLLDGGLELSLIWEMYEPFVEDLNVMASGLMAFYLLGRTAPEV